MFPLGTTAGKIELRANELSKPQIVPYEIKARRTTRWIYFITGAGFLCGWFIRVYLTTQQEIAEASADASGVVAEILAASSQIPDVTFQRQTTEIRKALSDSLNSGKPEVIRAAASTAKAELQAAVSEFNRLRQEVVGRVEPLRSLIFRRWKLTPLLMKSVEEISSRTQHTVQLLEGNSVADARTGLADIETLLFPELFNQCHAWRRDVVCYLRALQQHPLPQTTEGAEKFKKGVEAWIESFGTTTNVTTQTTIAQLAEALEQTHAARAALDELGLHAAREVVRLATWIDEALDATLRPDKADQFAALTRLNREIAETLPVSFDDPAQAAANHPGRMLQLQRSWGEVLAAIAPVGAAMDAVRDALYNDQWCVAIEQVKALLPSVKFGRSIPSMDESATADSNAARPIIFRSTYVGGTEVAAVHSMPIVSLSGSLAERSRFDRNARRAVFIQTVFFATLFMFIADALYSARWVGTTIEMLGLFVWAFGVDISSEAVMNAARKFAPKGVE
jgi:HAMP domain-containing protein